MKKIITPLFILFSSISVANPTLLKQIQNEQEEIKTIVQKNVEQIREEAKKEVEQVIEQEKTNAFLKEQMFEPAGDVIKSYNSKPFSAYFSWKEAPGFFKYEDYVVHLEKTPEAKVDMFKGIIVNNDHGRVTSDYEFYEKPELNAENIAKHAMDMRMYNLLDKLTGFQLTSYTRSLEDTAFLFVDFEYQPRKIASYLVELQQYAKALNKNIVVFPIAFLNDSSTKEAFNTLKLFALDHPENILVKKQADVSLLKESIFVSEEIAQRLLGGIDSNNLVYYIGLGFANEMSLLKLENGQFKVTHDFLDEDKLSDFFNMNK